MSSHSSFYLFFSGVCLSFLGLSSASAETLFAEHEKSGITVIRTTIELPVEGAWHIRPETGQESQVGNLQLKPTDKAIRVLQGHRMKLLQQKEALDRNRRLARHLFWDLIGYAKKHGGMSADRLLDLDLKRIDYHEKQKTEEQFRLIPKVRIYRDEPEMRNWAEPHSILAVERMPYLDDGKHWVLMSNGRVSRQPIDLDLMERLKLVVVPGKSPDVYEGPVETVPYHLYATRFDQAKSVIGLTLRDWRSEELLPYVWNLGKDMRPAKPSEPILNEWVSMQRGSLRPSMQGDAALLSYWVQGMDHRFTEPNSLASSPRVQGPSASTMNVIGGRAAIEETLQLQALNAGREALDAKRILPVNQIKGVTVTSHPFDKMLEGEVPGRLSLADFAPEDRMFMYFAKPQELLKMVDSGSGFILASAVGASGRQLQYDLADRMLARLGLTETLVRGFLEAGMVKESALLFPDLFFIDGTDISVLCRLQNKEMAGFALKALGMRKGAGADGIIKLDIGQRGRAAYWTVIDDVIIGSSQLSELERIKTIRGNPKSLGESAELQFMLTRVPLKDSSLAFLYFSDPFIRRLVSPSMKIAQLRRIQIRTELEGLSAGALAHQLELGRVETDLAVLERKGYIPKPVLVNDASLDDNFVSSSDAYGEAGNLATLLETPVDKVSVGELEAYQQYLRNYNRYWRRFFDPIAIRIDTPEPGLYEATTFILPLLDNSIYENIRTMVPQVEQGLKLQVPILAKPPPALLSANISDRAWLEIISDFLDEFLGNNMGFDSRLFDQLGPDVHVAIQDADPILALGSGELSSIMGAMQGGDMAGIGLMISMFTRPMHIMVGLDNSDESLKILKAMSTLQSNRRWLFSMGNSSVHKVTGEDRWIVNIQVEDLITLRYGIEIQDRFLIISNLPLTDRINIVGLRQVELNGIAMQLDPSACRLQLPALQDSAMRKRREAAIRGVDYLYPFMLTGIRDVETAQARHQELFGFRPSHPVGGEWIWSEGELRSTQFGSVAKQEQPAFAPGVKGQFGSMERLANLHIACQFELDGLRAKATWELKKSAGK